MDHEHYGDSAEPMPTPRRSGPDHYYDACKPDIQLPAWAFKVWRETSADSILKEEILYVSPQTFFGALDALAAAEVWLKSQGITATLPL